MKHVGRHVKNRAAASVGRYRARLREQGFRPLQIWVPDTRSPRFAAECRRQSLRVAGDASDRALAEELASGLDDLADWKP
jgi:hypothetical protein